VGRILVLVALVLVATPAAHAQPAAAGTGSGTPAVNVDPYIRGGIEFMWLTLPSELVFARGGPFSLKTCSTCEEPDRPRGVVFDLAAGVSLELFGKVAVWYDLNVPVVFSGFRSGFTDSRRWPAPAEGEAYVYSRVARILPMHSVSVAAVRALGASRLALGVRASRFDVRIEQGYDRFNEADPRRTFSGRAVSWSVFVRNHQPSGQIFNLEVGPFGTIDYGPGVGKGSVRGLFSASAGFAF
jgi:hypothetical protein